MKHLTRLAIAFTLTVAAAGCSVAGSWRTVSVEPPEAEFPIERLSLDKQSNFTATGPIHHATRTRVGPYRLAWRTLTLMPADGPAEEYQCGLRLDGRLSLTVRAARASDAVSAVMEREP
jgi:hypothetical protein